MNGIEIISLVLAGTGTVFFIAGTAGLLRFGDVLTRLHALTKADNLGLGFVALAVAMQSNSWVTGLKLMIIWLVVMLASSSVCFLVARRNLRAQANGEKDP